MNLKELSSLLGLSQTTVSRALNGYSDVKVSTRARVVTDRLHFLFHSIVVPLPAVSFHHSQEVLELRGDADTEASTSKPKLEYTDFAWQALKSRA